MGDGSTSREELSLRLRRRPSLLRVSGYFVGGFVALQIVFFLFLVVGQAVPDRPILTHLIHSINAGTYGPSSTPDRMGGTSDAFTECVVVGTGLGSNPGESAFDRAVYMPRISNCARGVEDIRLLAAGGDPVNGDYYKYWAGYTIITRPVLALAGMDGVRIVAGAMLLGSLVLAFSQVARRTSKYAALALMGPVLLATNIMSTPSTSFSQAISLSFIFLSTALVAWGAGGGRARLAGSTILGAALFCFVDLLTTPAIPWALASAVAAAVTYRRFGKLAGTVAAGVGVAVLWPLSFFLTWASRWAIAALFLGWNEVTTFVRGNVEYRTAGKETWLDTAFGAPTRANALFWLNHVPTSRLVLLAVLLLGVVTLLIAVRRGGVRRIGVAMVLALPVLVVPVWYEALSNHSQIHAFFTYRAVPVALGICLFACAIAMVERRRDAGTGRHEAVAPAEPQKESVS
ncbi:hypothetical protein [uncultured Arthrobacter sp.]|uniref:hypothetical protein n=1 Tax=uncultured Arthrobacter sp. TaxID=114050 RepID=UPI0025D57C15|nr:hypothetical protein [uncultured Arthrobacter sp.]